MSFPVEADLAPIARLLIYAILPDGEVVGDSAKYEVENCLPNKVGVLSHMIFNISNEKLLFLSIIFYLRALRPKDVNSPEIFQQSDGRVTLRGHVT